MLARLGRALKFPEDYLPMVQVLDDARLDTIETNEAETAHDLFGSKETGELFFVAQPVLQGQHHSGRTHQWGQQAGELIVGSGLEGDDDEFGDADLRWRASAFGPDLKI